MCGFCLMRIYSLHLPFVTTILGSTCFWWVSGTAQDSIHPLDFYWTKYSVGGSFSSHCYYYGGWWGHCFPLATTKVWNFTDKSTALYIPQFIHPFVTITISHLPTTVERYTPKGYTYFPKGSLLFYIPHRPWFSFIAHTNLLIQNEMLYKMSHYTGTEITFFCNQLCIIHIRKCTK